MLREKKDEGGLKDISTEEGENKKREDNDKENEKNKERGEKVLPTKTKSQLAREGDSCSPCEGNPLTFGSIKEGKRALLCPLPRHIQEAGNHHTLQRGLVANARVYKISEGPTHKEG